MSEELAGSTPPEQTEFSPPILRRTVQRCVVVLASVLVGVLVGVLILVLTHGLPASSIASLIGAIFLHFLPPALVLAWVATIGLVLLIRMISPRHGRLVFYDGKVHGQAKGKPWREVEFPLSQLDRPRSCSRGIYQRLGGYQVLHSLNSEKIYWERASFSQEAVARVLNRLRCA